MGGDQIAAVDCRRDGGAHLQRGHSHGLTEGRGGQLHLAQTALAVILHKAGLIGQIHTGALGKSKGIKVIIEQAGAHALAQLDEIDVAAVAQGLGQILGPVRLSAGTVVGLLCHAVSTGAVQGGVIGRLAAVHTHGGGDDLEHASGVVQLGDGLVLPLDIPVGAGVVGLLIHDLLAILVPQVVAVLVFFVDGVQLRLSLHLLRQIGQIGAEILRVIGVKVRLGGHGKDGTGLDVHHNGAAAVLNGVGRHGLVQVALHHLLNVHIQREHQIGAVLCGVGGGVFIGNGVAVGVAQGDGAAIHTGQRGLIGVFQTVHALTIRIAEAQHGGGKAAVGVIPLEALGGRHRHPPLADSGGAVVALLLAQAQLGQDLFQRTGGFSAFAVGLVVGLDVFLNGELDGVVDLGGQHLIGAFVLGEGIADRLILGLVLR